MPITFKDIKDRVRPPVDFNEIEEPRGLYFERRLLINYEGKDLSGCVFYKCFPEVGQGALEITVATSISDVSLQDADLEGAKLWGANLRDAYLQGTNLKSANLKNAELWNANLCDANLENADLTYAKAIGANLQGANLTDAVLEHTYLRRAKYDSQTSLANTITEEQRGKMTFVEDED